MSHQIKDALEKAGYNAERARTLAQKSNGNLSSLCRLLQNLSSLPEWAQGTEAADLSIAEIIGGWSDEFGADKLIAENLSGKPYGEWIKAMQEIALRTNTPLDHRESIWKFLARYEGWYVLGPKLFDEDLDSFKAATVEVLTELNPKFELPSEKRVVTPLCVDIFGNH